MSSPIVFIDLETRSRVDLKAYGGRVYAADPSTELLCGTAVVDYGAEVHVYGWAPWGAPTDPRAWISSWPTKLSGVYSAPRVVFHPTRAESDDPPDDVAAAIRAGAPLVAWNAHGFDRHIWRGLELPESRWLDALDRARRRGLPGGLDAVGESFYGIGKDKAGQTLLTKLRQPQKARAGQPEGRWLDPAPAAIAGLLRYCARDSLLLAAIWRDEDLGAEHVDDLVLEAHEKIDERGVPIDLDLCERLARCEADFGREAEKRAEQHGASPSTLRSAPGLLAWMRQRGVNIDNIQAGTIETVMGRATIERDRALAAGSSDEATQQAIIDVCEARLAVARVAAGKLVALIKRSGPGDARYRGAAAYYGAHTGRWAGRGAQTQNFPRPIEGLDVDTLVEDLSKLPEVAAKYKVSVPALIAAILRAVVRASSGKLLATMDFASIEARGILWLADDEPGLEVYRAYDRMNPLVEAALAAGDKAEAARLRLLGPDAYVAQAAELYRIPVADVTKAQRQAGKVAILACGYQGGAGAVERMAAKGRIDLRAAGIDPSGVVEGWRDSHAPVAGTRTGKTIERPDGSLIVMRKGGLWKGYQKAARLAIQDGESTEWGKCGFERDGAHLILTLPSGRPIVYREARIDLIPSKWSGEPKPTITYLSPRGRTTTYGGKISENVTQAACRDLLAEAMVLIEAAGEPIVLHVHDELVGEVDSEESLDRMRRIATTSPPWAVGLPLATSGACGPRWSK